MTAVKKLNTTSNLENIPFCLRQLADKIEAGEENVDSVVMICRDAKNEEMGFALFGQDMTISQLLGLIELTKLEMHMDYASQ